MSVNSNRFFQAGVPFAAFLLACHFLLGTIPANGCGPYHEWKTLGETVETALGDGAVRDCQFGLAVALGESIPQGKALRICVVEVISEGATNEVSLAEGSFDEEGLAAGMARIYTGVKAFSHIEVIPRSRVLEALKKRGMDIDRLFNPAVMEEISREAGIDGFIYASVRDPKVLTRLSSDLQPGAIGVVGQFEVQSLSARAKLINGTDGMIEWIDEIPGRYERAIIYRPLSGATSEVVEMAGAASGRAFELLEYIVTLKNSPGSESFVSHDVLKTTGAEGLARAAAPYVVKAGEALGRAGLVKP